jgi:ATP-dependent DNA helicase RecQ
MISLMKDQVDKLNSVKRRAAFINSTLTNYEAEKILREIAEDKIKLLYISPEKTDSPQFRRRLSEYKFEYLFVDEAHCISEWGHNFRPSYRKISEFAEALNLTKISAFTATATPEVRKDIVRQLKLSEPKIFVRGFSRPNLALKVITTNKKKEELLRIFSFNQTPAIVYCSTRKETEETAEFLRLHGYAVNHYHAGLSAELRKLIQDDFASGRLEVICATNAFGMGIDKENIRTIVHYNIPASIENYYQEIGRAGRDGKLSNIYLLYSKRDSSIHKYLISNSYPTYEEVKIVYTGIADYSRVALGSLYEGEIPLDKSFYKFFAAKDLSKSKVDNAISLLKQSGYLVTSSPSFSDYTIRSLLAPAEMKTYIQKIARKEYAEVLTAIAGLYLSAPFSSETKINLNKIAHTINSTFSKVRDNLRELDVIGIVAFNEPEEFMTVRLKTTRVRSDELNIDFTKTEDLIENQLKKLEQMVDYALTKDCRMSFILNYFGEENELNCGICDNCSQPDKEAEENEAVNNYLSEIILNTLKDFGEEIKSELLINALTGKSRAIKAREIPNYGSCKNYSNEELKSAIDFLNDSGKVSIFNGNISINEVESLELSKEANKEQSNRDYEKDLELFGKLSKVRSDAAKKFNQPPYMICKDELLREVVRKMPRDKFDFLSISGANMRVWNKIGEDVIQTIKNFNELNQRKPTESKVNKIPENLLTVRTLLERKYSLEEISKAAKLPESVVSMQIESLLAYVPETEINGVVSDETLELINKVISDGFIDLKEIKSRLPQSITYAEIRIALAKRNAQKLL